MGTNRSTVGLFWRNFKGNKVWKTTAEVKDSELQMQGWSELHRMWKNIADSLYKTLHQNVKVILCLFWFCLFKVYRPTREFFTHMETITGDGLQILTYARHSWPLSSEDSLQLLWRGASVYNGHLRGPVILTPTNSNEGAGVSKRTMRRRLHQLKGYRRGNINKSMTISKVNR